MLFIIFSYAVFLWDNDSGYTFYDSDLGVNVGYQLYLYDALNYNLSVFGDTLIENDTLPELSQLRNYDAIFIVNGPRKVNIISLPDLNNIESYMGSGGDVYMEGNNIAEFLHFNHPALLDSFYAEYSGSTVGTPVGYIYGYQNTFTEGEEFSYFTDAGMNYDVDIIGAIFPADTILVSSDQKAYVCRATAYSYSAEKSGLRTSIISSINISGFKKRYPYQNSFRLRREFVRKVLAYMGISRILYINRENYGEPDFIKQDLVQLGYKNVDDTLSIPDTNYMKRFAVVIWNTGKNSSTLTGDDTIRIKSYMDYGGRIMMTGENIAENLFIPGYTNILQNYFGIFAVQGTISCNIIKGLKIYSSVYAHYVPTDPDIIWGYDTSFIYLSAKSDECAGISHTKEKTKSLFLGYSYNHIQEEDERRKIMDITMKYWGIRKESFPSGFDEKNNDKNEKYIIIFKDTEIPYPLYDLTGRKINRLERKGIYIYKGKEGIRKVIYIR